VIDAKKLMRLVLTVLLATALLLMTWDILFQSGERNDRIERVSFTNAEKWTSAVNSAGQGEIRYGVDVLDSLPGPGRIPAGLGKVSEVKTEGPVTAEAKFWISCHCDNIINGASKKLDSYIMPGGQSDFQVAVDQLAALKDIYVYTAMKELVASGSYITYTKGQFPPSSPDGCMTVSTTQYPLQNGKEGHAVFWIDTRYRRELQEIYELLKETRTAARWERIRSWNERPEAARQSEIEEYLQLSAKAMDDPTANLTSVEFARYWRMRLLLLELNAEVVHGRSFLFERSGGQPR
jgi:hypothetical protein